MKPVQLSPADRAFFDRVASLVVANPFGAERSALDHELDRDHRQTPAGRLERIKKLVSARLKDLERSGDTSLQRVASRDRGTLAYTFLFDLFHAWTGPFDRLITSQEESPDEPCPVPFAGELLAAFERRGFEQSEALKNLGLFFQLRRAYTFIDRALVGRSACMQELREALWNNIFTRDIRWYGAWLLGRMEDFSTLLLGETGTGKGSAAGAIGRSGFIPFDPKRGRFVESFASAFVSLNLSEFPESLIESELFGHEKGAFTGALERRDGVFASCSPHGAIFLDEIGELSAPVQIKLLRVLQDRVFTPVGSRRAKRFRGRVIAASNRRLEELRSGLLRNDFFYRLCSDVIIVPPLRRRLEEAPEELELLVDKLLERMLDADARALLEPVCSAIERELGRGYAWPGNVRELEQCVRRILLKGRYEGTALLARSSPEDPFLELVARGELDADELLGGYCARLLERLKNCEEVARRTRLDRRTVRRYVELATRTVAAKRER